MASLRLSLQSSGFALHSRQLQRFLALPAGIRHASTAPPPKPRVLEKPERFNPPSHPSRLRAKPRTYGAPLSENERQAQKTRKYPHMMPPEGTFMFWFLTNRAVHLWITIGILFFLTTGIWYQDFVHTTPYKDMLPPNSMFFAHPFKFISRYIEVYDLHAGYVSEKTSDMRKQKVDDVKKRSEYRKAHGLEEGEGVFGGWTAKPDVDPSAVKPELEASPVAEAIPLAREGGTAIAEPAVPVQAGMSELAKATTGEGPTTAETYVDFDGKERPVEKKKWFGIW